jgi:hypothetical protein
MGLDRGVRMFGLIRRVLTRMPFRSFLSVWPALIYPLCQELKGSGLMVAVGQRLDCWLAERTSLSSHIAIH